jgi:hypothetical protein
MVVGMTGHAAHGTPDVNDATLSVVNEDPR